MRRKSILRRQEKAKPSRGRVSWGANQYDFEGEAQEENPPQEEVENTSSSSANFQNILSNFYTLDKEPPTPNDSINQTSSPLKTLKVFDSDEPGDIDLKKFMHSSIQKSRSKTRQKIQNDMFNDLEEIQRQSIRKVRNGERIGNSSLKRPNQGGSEHNNIPETHSEGVNYQEDNFEYNENKNHSDSLRQPNQLLNFGEIDFELDDTQKLDKQFAEIFDVMNPPRHHNPP